MEQKFDITISQSRFYIGQREAEADDYAWGEGNAAQGALILPDVLVLDPLADETFGADVIFRQPLKFSPDKRAQRTLQLPLVLTEETSLCLGSLEDIEETAVLAAGEYTLIYEVCVGRDVFYTLTLLKQPCETAMALKADGWGLKKQQVLQLGRF